jgi:hypothetical protein
MEAVAGIPIATANANANLLKPPANPDRLPAFAGPSFDLL